MKNRPLVIVLVVTVVAAATALLLRAWRLLRAPRTESEFRGLPAGSDASATSSSAPSSSDPASSARDGDGARQAASGEQTEESGVGDLLHRRYQIDIPCDADHATLLRAIQQHMTELSPASLAEFEKSVGNASGMEIGDEYDITMLGPWNGRVRVCDVTDSSFTLVTLEGHPEAGHITFSVMHDDVIDEAAPSSLRVRIESWARARDMTVKLAYDSLGVGKQVQTEVWVTFLQRVAALAGATDSIDVQVTTERHESEEAQPDGATRDGAHG